MDTTTAPYHPASNRLAERVVGADIEERPKEGDICNYVYQTSQAPVPLRDYSSDHDWYISGRAAVGKKTSNLFGPTKTQYCRKSEEMQEKQKTRHNQKAKSRTFCNGDLVFVKNVCVGNRWLPGQIMGVLGTVSFHVQLEYGREKKCHQDHLKAKDCG